MTKSINVVYRMMEELNMTFVDEHGEGHLLLCLQISNPVRQYTHVMVGSWFMLLG